MQKKALGRGLDALINGGLTAPVPVQAPGTAAPVVPAKPLGTVPSATPVVAKPVPPAVLTPAVAAPTPVSVPAPKPIESADGIQHIDIDAIEPNRYQPRSEFDQEHLQELADSIRQRGVMQPLMVRPIARPAGPVRYELIAGERRWRAAREAGLKAVPTLIRQASDEEALEIALIENLQRENLNPIEEARAYGQLAAVFKLTQEKIADKVGRSRAAVANSLRLLTLPSEVLSWITNGQLSVGHAKVILSIPSAEEQRLVAERVLKKGMTVRDTEQLVEQLKADPKVRARALSDSPKSTHVIALEEALQQKLGTHVALRHGKKKGRIVIEYYGNDELTRLLGVLGVEDL